MRKLSWGLLTGVIAAGLAAIYLTDFYNNLEMSFVIGMSTFILALVVIAVSENFSRFPKTTQSDWDKIK